MQVKQLQDLSREEFFNHVGTVLITNATGNVYSINYLLELASEAKRRNFMTVEETVLNAAAGRAFWSKAPASAEPAQGPDED